MDIKNKLLAYGKKSITLEALTDLLKADPADTKGLYDRISELAGASILEPVKNSGQNGNRKYPLFKKYRIMIKEESSEEVEKQIRQLHPALQRTGYLSLHVKEYLKHREVVDCLNTFLFSRKAGEQISRKERSFEIFGREKVLDDPEVKSLLRHLEISESDLGFYDTPEYCFHDYIPERKNDLTLLICENKDIWFNIRRCMFEDHFKSLFGVAIDGVVYGNGSKVSNKAGALVEYVRFMGNPNVTLSTKYSRKGLALSFFAKPDVSYYGGSEEQYIQVCEPLGATFVAGTSFAAPWIARKLAYLIDVLGLNREIAKALIIDAARGWNDAPTPEEVALYGHGIVPIKITDIIQTPEDEIRFLVTDVSEKWNTYNYHFPIPLKADTYPYYARATMCYFPLCDRAQGVDYTNTELNLHFGRIQDDGKLNEINDDKQNLDDIGESRSYILEGDARERFRKWDNVKYVAEKVKDRRVPKKSYRNKNWGMEIKTNNRLDPEDGVGLRFGVVVTIKEMYGINRIDEFIKNCNLNGWLVNAIDIQNRIEIHEKINEEIRFD